MSSQSLWSLQKLSLRPPKILNTDAGAAEATLGVTSGLHAGYLRIITIQSVSHFIPDKNNSPIVWPVHTEVTDYDDK